MMQKTLVLVLLMSIVTLAVPMNAQADVMNTQADVMNTQADEMNTQADESFCRASAGWDYHGPYAYVSCFNGRVEVIVTPW